MNEDLFKALVEDDSSVIADKLTAICDEMVDNDIRYFSMYVYPNEESNNESAVVRAFDNFLPYLSSCFPSDNFLIEANLCWSWGNRIAARGYIELNVYR